MNPESMRVALIIAMLGACLIVVLIFYLQDPSGGLKLYLERACNGPTWRDRFPDVPKTEIRAFLELFVDSFGITSKHRLKFHPDDPILGIYRTRYPSPSLPDMCELETFAHKILEKYQFDLHLVWREDLTLGELYAKIHIPHA